MWQTGFSSSGGGHDRLQQITARQRSVFLAVILATLISLSLMLVHAARQEAIISVADGVMQLAADSIMSEYNRDIQKEYGISV